MNTDTPAPDQVQPKSLDEKIELCAAREKMLYEVVTLRAKELEELQKPYEHAREAWCKEWNRLNMLKEMKKEGVV
jgi:hypothetical protein